MAKKVKKVKVNGEIHIVKNAFTTTKKEYKVGDTIELTSKDQVSYLQRINKI